jgi:hypothetical protein
MGTPARHGEATGLSDIGTVTSARPTWQIDPKRIAGGSTKEDGIT